MLLLWALRRGMLLMLLIGFSAYMMHTTYAAGRGAHIMYAAHAAHGAVRLSAYMMPAAHAAYATTEGA